MSIKNTALFAGSVMEYWWRYFSNRRFSVEQEFYVVYSDLDHGIPFQTDSALNYWLINFKILPATIKLGDVLPDERFNDIRLAYLALVRQGIAAFRKVPTIMPHFGGYAGPPILAGSLLKQINCSPSLHTAAPFLLYNMGAEYLPEDEPELRRHIGDIVSTVIKTKKHAMIDVAFGMFLCQTIIEDKLGLEFRTLETFFTGAQKTRDSIPYEQIYRMYREINELAKTGPGGGADLPWLMEEYFQEIGLPRIRRERSNCLYDLKQKALVYPPELTIGKGWF